MSRLCMVLYEALSDERGQYTTQLKVAAIFILIYIFTTLFVMTPSPMCVKFYKFLMRLI